MLYAYYRAAGEKEAEGFVMENSQNVENQISFPAVVLYNGQDSSPNAVQEGEGI